eukprot:362388-Chlamydomonas_euryale.AAC.5
MTSAQRGRESSMRAAIAPERAAPNGAADARADPRRACRRDSGGARRGAAVACWAALGRCRADKARPAVSAAPVRAALARRPAPATDTCNVSPWRGPHMRLHQALAGTAGQATRRWRRRETSPTIEAFGAWEVAEHSDQQAHCLVESARSSAQRRAEKRDAARRWRPARVAFRRAPTWDGSARAGV